ncbi:MAG: hypothetical protein JNM94_08480 [Phycisphaerae bacterium]|nr:hypothetical protein [Phycisphaerae bacterium]
MQIVRTTATLFVPVLATLIALVVFLLMATLFLDECASWLSAVGEGRPTYGIEVVFFAWVFVLAAATCSLGGYWCIVARESLRRGGECPRCSYDLRGSDPRGVCPECGKQLSADQGG